MSLSTCGNDFKISLYVTYPRSLPFSISASADKAFCEFALAFAPRTAERRTCLLVRFSFVVFFFFAGERLTLFIEDFFFSCLERSREVFFLIDFFAM